MIGCIDNFKTIQTSNDDSTKQKDPCEIKMKIMLGESLIEYLKNQVEKLRAEDTKTPSISSPAIEKRLNEQDLQNFMDTLTRSQQESLLKNLPRWLETCYEGKIIACELFDKQVDEKTPDNEVIDKLNTVVRNFINNFIESRMATMLRGLIVPTTDQIMAKAVEHIIYQSWKGTIQELQKHTENRMNEIAAPIFGRTNSPEIFMYAWNDFKYISKDSYQILLNVTEQCKENILQQSVYYHIKDTQVKEKLNFSIAPSILPMHVSAYPVTPIENVANQ